MRAPAKQVETKIDQKIFLPGFSSGNDFFGTKLGRRDPFRAHAPLSRMGIEMPKKSMAQICQYYLKFGRDKAEADPPRVRQGPQHGRWETFGGAAQAASREGFNPSGVIAARFGIHYGCLEPLCQLCLELDGFPKRSIGSLGCG